MTVAARIDSRASSNIVPERESIRAATVMERFLRRYRNYQDGPLVELLLNHGSGR